MPHELKTLNGEPYHFNGVPFPFAHQVDTTQFILDTPRCFVFNDIGTGKTLSAVWAVDYLIQKKIVKNVLIVAPLSTLDAVWFRTFFHISTGIDVQVLKGSAQRKIETLKRDASAKVSIVNPESLHILSEAMTDWAAIDEPDMIIIDESAMFRNAKARRRMNALNYICRRPQMRVVCMTGSPCPEAPTDVWATAKIVCPHRVSKWFGQFRDLTMRKISQFKWVALPDAQETVAALLKGYHIRYRRDECIDLPPRHSSEIELTPSDEQKTLMHTIRKEAIAVVENGAISAANEAVIISKLLQIASGAVRFTRQSGDVDVIETDCQSKFDALEQIIESSAQPVIVFAPYTAVIKRIGEWLSSKNIPHGMVAGSVSARERLAHFDALQDGTIKVLVAHPQAMSHGVTLTNSNIITWWTPIFSNEIYEQANGRITRPGQVRSQYVIHLTCSAIESRVLRRLESKSALQGILLDYLQREET